MSNTASHTPSATFDVTLNEEEVSFLRSFIGEEEGTAPMPIRLQYGEGHSGHGLYLSSRDYPEEGSSLLVATQAPEAAPAQKVKPVAWAAARNGEHVFVWDQERPTPSPWADGPGNWIPLYAKGQP